MLFIYCLSFFFIQFQFLAILFLYPPNYLHTYSYTRKTREREKNWCEIRERTHVHTRRNNSTKKNKCATISHFPTSWRKIMPRKYRELTHIYKKLHTIIFVIRFYIHIQYYYILHVCVYVRVCMYIIILYCYVFYYIEIFLNLLHMLF